MESRKATRSQMKKRFRLAKPNYLKTIKQTIDRTMAEYIESIKPDIQIPLPTLIRRQRELKEIQKTTHDHDLSDDEVIKPGLAFVEFVQTLIHPNLTRVDDLTSFLSDINEINKFNIRQNELVYYTSSLDGKVMWNDAFFKNNKISKSISQDYNHIVFY
jgi:hypothetical protein